MTNSKPFKQEPGLAVALTFAMGLAGFCGLIVVPRSLLQEFRETLPRIEIPLALIGMGLLYLLSIFSNLVRTHLLLGKPGQTIAALRKPERSVAQLLRRHTVSLLNAILFSGLLTNYFALEGKLLAKFLRWSETFLWWIPSFILFLPLSLGCSDLGLSLLARLTSRGRRSSALPPWPANKENELTVTLGSSGEETENPKWVTLSEKEMLKSMMISGGVGFGKTQLIFRILDQLFGAHPGDDDRKLSFLILDPKGDMVPTVRALAEKNGRAADLVFIGESHSTSWNPLFFPDLQLSGRFRDVAERFKAAMINYQGGASHDPFWIESGTNLVGWLIWLSASSLEDVTFGNLYKLLLTCSSQEGNEPDTLDLILKQAEKKIAGLEKTVQEEQFVNLETCKLYLERDFRKMPEKTRMNVVANLSSFLQLFLSSEAQRLFSPRREEASFGNIRELVDSGKILVLDMTQNDRPGLCRAVGTLLKLSYQNAIMSRLAGGKTPERLACLVMDEYQNFATNSHGETQFGDDRFFDQCRAAKGFGILATQSYATLTMVLKKEAAAHELLGQIAHKITFATDEPSTCAYFRRLAGKHWVKRHSESISESSSNARKTLFQDGLTTEKSSVGMSYSTSEVEVDSVKDEDIAKLPPFKAFAALKMGDGPKTHFLYTRPLFDPAPHKPFIELASRLSILLLCVLASVSAKSVVPPNICEAMNVGAALSCFGVRQGPCTCHSFGFPYPCARITYWVPKTFVEVSPRIGESYFSMIPIVKAQLVAGIKTWNWGVNKLGAMGTGLLNVGEVDDNGSSFFHVHTAPVLLSHEVLKGLPCGSPSYSLPCLSAMSEHHPIQWSTGYFDFQQLQTAGTQICGGTVDSVGSVIQSTRRLLDGPVGDLLAGAGVPGFASPEGAGCSIPLAASLGSINPSTEMPCVGSLGSIFPRYGTVNGPTNVSGALAAAYKFRSLASEHFGTVPKGGTEKWQMVRPKTSGCFFPGENLFMVEGLFTPSLRDEFLFLVWEKRSCCVDYVRNGFGLALLSGVKATCAAMGSR